MASKAVASTALLLTLNLLFFTMVSSTYVPCPPPPHKKTPPSPKAPSTPKTPPSPKAPSVPKTPPSPKAPSVPKTPPSPKTPTTPTPVTPSPSSQSKCPSDTLKLGVCGNLLSGLVNVVVGGSADRSSCCGLIQGLADLDAAVCLCTAIKANVLGINLNVPISLSLLLNACDKSLPSGFQCS